MTKATFKKALIPASAVFVLAAFLVAVPACTPTYPKEKLPQAVKSVCKQEYDMDVDVTLKGSTMGIYYPMKGLLDAGMGISEDAWDNISNLILIASRVVLSTDADVKFYCVITQDVRLPELQVVIIKYVEDVKRGMVRNISRSESFKRTLFSINLTPQAKKERSIEKVFNKLGVGEDTRQKVLEEFFRSPPTRLSDIGYWRDNFYLKDITLEEFLASQIANRIKIDFRQDEKLAELFSFKASEGLYVAGEQRRSFLVKFKIADQTPGDRIMNPRVKKIEEILKIANRVFYGYKFQDFDTLVLEDQLENANLSISEEDIYNLNRKRVPIEELVNAPAGYFNAVN
ncbi:MAG: hypothetical protein GF409_08410 [Candidatus Omnitrophica bacterium]|nr:hypothetical protein [Candidatus Omnitrophota bacterium]